MVIHSRASFWVLPGYAPSTPHPDLPAVS